jgi:hypothetical protein
MYSLNRIQREGGRKEEGGGRKEGRKDRRRKEGIHFG